VREDDDEIGHYMRVWSRTLVLSALIIGVPVILSTITAFVRNQPKVSAFHNLLATASINVLRRATVAEPAQQQYTPPRAKLADPQEAAATATEKVEPERPLLIDNRSDTAPSAPDATQVADTSSTSAATSNSDTPMVAEAARSLPPVLAANNGAAPGRRDAVVQMEPTGTAESDVLSSSAPLPGPIQLPRRRLRRAAGDDD
jgi:hypothetical protein